MERMNIEIVGIGNTLEISWFQPRVEQVWLFLEDLIKTLSKHRLQIISFSSTSSFLLLLNLLELLILELRIMRGQPTSLVRIFISLLPRSQHLLYTNLSL